MHTEARPHGGASHAWGKRLHMDLVKWVFDKLDGMTFVWTWRFGGPKNEHKKLGEHNQNRMGSKKHNRGSDKGE